MPIKESYEVTRSYAHSWKTESTDPKDTTIILNIVSWDSADEGACPPTYRDSPGMFCTDLLFRLFTVVPQLPMHNRADLSAI